MKIAVFLVLVLGMGTAQAVRNPPQSEFISKVIKRMAHIQDYGRLSSKRDLLISRTDLTALRKELNISRDWDSVVENLFAAFGPAKVDQLTEIYQWSDLSSKKELQKDLLHSYLISGANGDRVDTANKMVEMGLELDKVDLQGLLLYSLQESPHNIEENSNARMWWDWLVAHGASVDEPHIIELFKDAALTNDVFRLDWLKDNLLTDTAADRATFISALNVALPLTPRTGAGQAAMWLLKHGADASVLEETDLLRTAMFSSLIDTGSIRGPLAQYVSKSGHEHLLSEMLSKIVSSGVMGGVSNKHIRLMEVLPELGAKLPPKHLQEVLQRSLTVGNFVIASWAAAHGADLNTLDLNSILSTSIEEWQQNKKQPRKSFHVVDFNSVDTEGLFAFLRVHGLIAASLDVAQLPNEAEEKNVSVAIEQLKNVVSEQEENDSISAAEFWQQLYTEMKIERFTVSIELIDNAQLADDSADLLLQNVAADYYKTAVDLDVQNLIWLPLYISKVRGMSSKVDMLVEFIRLFPRTPILHGLTRKGVRLYYDRMDILIENMASTTEEKTTIAQSTLDQIFNSEATAEKYPFLLSLVNWAVDSGADLRQLDPYAVLRVIIDNEVLRLDPTNTVNLPSITDIENQLLQEEGFLQGIDQQRVLQEAEARGGVKYKAAAEKVMKRLKSPKVPARKQQTNDESIYHPPIYR